MIDDQPRFGLCTVCLTEPRAPGWFRCEGCESAHERRNTAATKEAKS